MTINPIERPPVIERPSTRRRLAVSSRLFARRAKRHPRLLILPGIIALAAGISGVAVLEATRVGGEPVETVAAVGEAPASVEAQVRESVAAAAAAVAADGTAENKDEARLAPNRAAPQAETAAPGAARDVQVAAIETGSVERSVDPAIAAIARMDQAVEEMPTEGTLAPPQAEALAGVEVAESEADIVALEASLIEQGSSGPFEVASADPGVSDEITASIATGMSPATINTYVNLRTGPSNDSSVIRVLPANAAVQATTDCRHFCEVVHEGTRGYVYKSYLNR